jgi:putative membrane protein
MQKFNLKIALSAIIGISVLAFIALIWLIYFRQPWISDSPLLGYLPAVNAALNALSACFVLAGVWAIKNKKIRVHKILMGAAFFASTIFLLSYVAYHSFHGDTAFLGEGVIRSVYFFILISHIVLTIGALPLILVTFFLGLTDRISIHRKVATFTFPLWLYVSVTGVLIYFLLRANSF